MCLWNTRFGGIYIRPNRVGLYVTKLLMCAKIKEKNICVLWFDKIS